MLSTNTQRNLRNAESYFDDHLSTGEYYAEGEQVRGDWLGKGASWLGLTGTVEKQAFLALCENLHPQTKERLTQRTKTTRETVTGGHESNRRIFYDFTFSPPKSVSILALVAGDQRIIATHRAAIRVAVEELERFAATRVRMGGSNDDRKTANLAAAVFEHDSSRMLDPHLHSHVVVFNVTRDPVEERWKALQNFGMLRAKKYAENVYYHELAKGLRSAGYQIRNRARGDFEMEGVSEEVLQRFSKRHTQIHEAVAALLKTRPELSIMDPKELREQLATRNRPRKVRNIGRPELEQLWRAQLSMAEGEQLRQLTCGKEEVGQKDQGKVVEQAIGWAEEHLFDRHSLVAEHQIWSEAIARARGCDISLSELKTAIAERGYVRNHNHPDQVTLPAVLARERQIVLAGQDGRNTCRALATIQDSTDPSLDVEQRFALKKLLASRDRITLFRGAAGTGKSYVLRELVRAVEANGQTTIVLAPQRQQVLELERSGLPGPWTVTSFLASMDLPASPVVIVDEAGQIGGKQMLDLIRIVERSGGRLVLSGDTRQHGPVQASAALLAIERHSGIEPITLRKIRRQDPDLARNDQERESIELYRQAVADASAGRSDDSFQRIDEMGAIIECEATSKAERLADEYLRLVEEGQSLVVVSQTWDEVRRVNEQVRSRLKAHGKLGSADAQVEILEPVDLTDAQKRDARFYAEDAVVVLNQPIRGITAGTQGRFLAADEKGVILEMAGSVVSVPKRSLGKLSIHRPRTIPLASGERLQLKANRRLLRGGVANNGELVTVDGVEADGSIRLQDGRVLDPAYREFLPGYALTSYGSQGKTVSYVLVSDSGNQAATGAEQWYVTISRGRKGIRIFTTDKGQLRENVLQSGHRPLAVDHHGMTASRNDEVNRRLQSIEPASDHGIARALGV